MNVVVFDIETSNEFSEVGSYDATALSISVVGLYQSATDSYESFLEADFPRLWKILETADMLVGYNSDHFDIPLLNKYYPGDLTRIKSLDLLKEIYGSLGRRLRLDSVAEGTLGEKKIGHGLQALQWWREGLVDKVREYCIKDVEITKKIFDYALQNGHVKYKELGQVREIKLDTSGWMAPNAQALTQTLGF